MKTLTVYDHDADSTTKALGVDREKMQLIIDHLNKCRREKKFHAVSQELVEIIKLGSTPEELVLMAYDLGKNASQIIKDLMIKSMLGKMKGLFDDEDDEDK